jgi:hypothetical protein
MKDVGNGTNPEKDFEIFKDDTLEYCCSDPVLGWTMLRGRISISASSDP